MSLPEIILLITTILVILISLLIIIFIIFPFICYRLVFHMKDKNKISKEEFPMPPGKVYEPYRQNFVEWIKQIRNIPHTNHEITSFDGLKLHGAFYEYKKGAVIELLIHGYQGCYERDLGGAIERCFKLGHSAFLIDQRGAGHSEGNVISFGIKERYDCLAWANYIVNHIDNDAKILLAGVSMGAATVLLASELNLPKNVFGVLADCGYSSPKEIIKKCTRQLHLPPDLFYPFIKLGAKMYGKFNLEEASPIDAVKNTKLPIIFFHGTADAFVPSYMSEKMYEVCNSKKKLVMIENAGHCLCYMIQPQLYLDSMNEFFDNFQ